MKIPLTSNGLDNGHGQSKDSKSSVGREEADKLACIMTEHLPALLELQKTVSSDIIAQSEINKQLLTGLEALTEQMQQANKHFASFIDVAKLGFGVLGKAVTVSLIAVICLCLAVIYVARLEIDYKNFHISRSFDSASVNDVGKN